MASEAVKWVERARRKLLLFKVDFAKAYDCLNWNFLDLILDQMNFSVKWRSWIWGCLSSAHLSILVNGSPTPEFRMEKGLRQGDPLSPFLFIIAAEALSIMMREATAKGVFKGAKVGNDLVEVTHLQFADDVFGGVVCWKRDESGEIIILF